MSPETEEAIQAARADYYQAVRAAHKKWDSTVEVARNEFRSAIEKAGQQSTDPESYKAGLAKIREQYEGALGRGLVDHALALKNARNDLQQKAEKLGIPLRLA